MATIQPIGSTRTFTTPAAWAAAIPSTPTGGYEGHCDAETFTSGVELAGHTTSAANYIKLTAAAGASWCDQPRTTALVYDASKGAAISANPFVTEVAKISNQDWTEITRLQIRRSGNSYGTDVAAMSGTVTNSKFTSCIILKDQTGPLNALAIQNGSAYNCLVYNTSATVGSGLSGQGGSRIGGCTVVNAAASGGIGIDTSYGTVAINSSCVFGYATVTTGTISGDYNCSNGTIFGTHSQSALTTANQLVSVTADFRPKAGGNLIAGGNTDSTNFPTDITGFTRALTTAGTCGCYEFAVAATAAPPPQRVGPNMGAMLQF